MAPLLTLCFVLLAVALTDQQDPYAVRDTCAQTGRTCLQEEARCHGDINKCVCNTNNPIGAGDFQCYKQNTVFCEIKNDPSLRTFGGENEHLPFMCKYLVSESLTNLKSKTGEIIGHCAATVHGVNKKSKGKTFVSGFEMTFVIRNDFDVHIFTLRHGAMGADNTNIAEYEMKWGWQEPFYANTAQKVIYDDQVKGVMITFHWDKMNNQFIFEAPACGVKITHVPFDIAFGIDQRQVPGLSIALSKDYEPWWPPSKLGVCLQESTTFRNIEVGEIGVQLSLLLREYKAPTRQEQTQCTSVRRILKRCPLRKQQAAIAACNWIFTRPHFMKCFDTSLTADDSLTLFERCVYAWCNDTPCTTAIDLIKHKGCDKLVRVPELEQFVLGNMCPRSSAV